MALNKRLRTGDLLLLAGKALKRPGAEPTA